MVLTYLHFRILEFPLIWFYNPFFVIPLRSLRSKSQKQIPYGVIIKSPYGDTFQIPLNTYKFWLEILMSNGHSSWSRGLVYA